MFMLSSASIQILLEWVKRSNFDVVYV